LIANKAVLTHFFPPAVLLDPKKKEKQWVELDAVRFEKQMHFSIFHGIPNGDFGFVGGRLGRFDSGTSQMCNASNATPPNARGRIVRVEPQGLGERICVRELDFRCKKAYIRGSPASVETPRGEERKIGGSVFVAHKKVSRSDFRTDDVRT
jgi:hypothetical protein